MFYVANAIANPRTIHFKGLEIVETAFPNPWTIFTRDVGINCEFAWQLTKTSYADEVGRQIQRTIAMLSSIAAQSGEHQFYVYVGTWVFNCLEMWQKLEQEKKI